MIDKQKARDERNGLIFMVVFTVIAWTGIALAVRWVLDHLL